MKSHRHPTEVAHFTDEETGATLDSNFTSLPTLVAFLKLFILLSVSLKNAAKPCLPDMVRPAPGAS